MNYKTSESQGIAPDQIEMLRKAGIEDTDGMLRLWAESGSSRWPWRRI